MMSNIYSNIGDLSHLRSTLEQKKIERLVNVNIHNFATFPRENFRKNGNFQRKHFSRFHIFIGSGRKG
jgi:hypothetical protein